jgi:hypothetical protein
MDRRLTLNVWCKPMKQVADNITESWLCVDCGVNTAPGVPDGPTTRAKLAQGREPGLCMNRYGRRQAWSRLAGVCASDV